MDYDVFVLEVFETVSTLVDLDLCRYFQNSLVQRAQCVGNENRMQDFCAIPSTVVFGKHDLYEVAIAYSKAFERYIGWGPSSNKLENGQGYRDN